MLEISPLGWVHTLASLPAIPLALYMLIRFGRIIPQSSAGGTYLVAMIVGAISAYPLASVWVSYLVATLTLLALAIGYGISLLNTTDLALRCIETSSLSFSTLLLMLPTITEIFLRLPEGAPLARSLDAPILLYAQSVLLVIFLLGLMAQLILLFRYR
ncbi:hypothetical protein [uncultured Ruegeria sp.]|uniref:hypothetical protein n=1 Tax=uncultured Ruegeria sp. TaxID=259304 RepID=UPI0026184BBD|nr:hypothetical protein [uncultured Ruegeria sp.]